LKIYYEDADIVVCEKEAGILSEGEGKDCMPYLLSEAYRSRGEKADIFTVHRLDRDTSGIMVYARTKSAAAALSKAITDGKFEKEYLADIHGMPESSRGRMEDLLFYDRTKNRSYAVKRMRKGVKDAALEYSVVSSEDGISSVRIKLLTGRTHQIRVQFASRKMPLVGDRRYGAPDTKRPLALRACLLSFSHPKTNEIMRFED
jgi:23S rRNA pseudouridine1911/1915/1917 synthase